MKYFAILGRQPRLGLAELESLLGAENIEPFSATTALINADIPADFGDRLGSIIKYGQIIDIGYYDGWIKLSKKITDIMKKQALATTDGKLTIGISVYGLAIDCRDIEKTGLNIKKILKGGGRSVRLVPNKTPALSTAQVLHNKLAKEHGIEVVVIGSGSKVVVGITRFEQDIEAYTARDQARPKRDAYIGMLPPKLAQTIINLAQGAGSQSTTLLDPFCGTGVILQEASLMGYNVVGTDNNPKMVNYSTQNLHWLYCKYPKLNTDSTIIELGDAQTHTWPKNIDIVATETYLGSPISMMPDAEKLSRLVAETNGLHHKTLVNLAKQLPQNTRLCLAVPTWRTKSGFKHLPTLDQLDKIGYNRIDFKYANRQDLIYIRENQFVGRELVVLTTK